MDTIIPDGYAPKMDIFGTEGCIKFLKDHFERDLARRLNLQRITAALFVQASTGIQDNLNGVERPVRFCVKGDGDAQCEIVQSLAKWKRLALYEYRFGAGEGIYTDVNALRPDEESLDNLHSIHVDQWDWERVIAPADPPPDVAFAAACLWPRCGLRVGVAGQARVGRVREDLSDIPARPAATGCRLPAAGYVLRFHAHYLRAFAETRYRRMPRTM